MVEYMFYIRNAKDAKLSMTPEKHFEFIRQCEVYISQLKIENKLIAAQPIIREGVVLKRTEEGWNVRDIATDQETQVGYYHIWADNMQEALRIAKQNPEFEFVPSATIEIRPVKTKETETGFIYPINDSHP